MKKTIVIALFGLLSSATVSSQTSEEDAVKKVILAFSEAGDKNDANLLALYLDTNYRVVMNRLFGSEEVSIIPKTVYLKKIESGEWGGDQRKLIFHTIDINDSVASVKVTFRGTKMTLVSVINLIKDKDGKWKLISDMPVIS